MNKIIAKGVFIMQSTHKKFWMESLSNNLNKTVISWCYITKCNHLGHLPLCDVCSFLFHMIANYLKKLDVSDLCFGEGWYDLLDPDLTWIVAVGGSSPWIWLLLGFLQRLWNSKSIAFDFSSLILQLAECYPVFQPRAGSVGLSKYEWEDLLGQRKPESSGFGRRFFPLVPNRPPSLSVCDPRGCSETY